MIIHATLIESIGFHYLFHQWNPVVAWVLLILNVYAMFYFLAEIQAMRKIQLLLQKKDNHSNRIRKENYYTFYTN